MMDETPTINIRIQVTKLGDLSQAGQAGHWDGLLASSGLSPEQLLGLRAYFASAVTAVQEALDRHKVEEAQRLRAELRAERPRRQPEGSALDQFIKGAL